MFDIRRVDNPEPHTIFKLISQLNPELSFAVFETRLRDMLTQNYFLLAAFEDEEMIALTGCWIGTKLYCGKYLEIDNFVVDEAHRSKSIGAKIMDRVFEEAKALKCEAITLNVYSWNDRAQKFYDAYGFESPGNHRVLHLKSNN